MHERVGPRTIRTDEELLGDVISLRNEYVRTSPITNETITRLDKWLVNQPRIPMRAAVQVWLRCMLTSAIAYESTKDRETKHYMLLDLKAHFEEFKQWPEKLQEPFRPAWLEWLDVLQTEERWLKEKADANTN